MNNQEEQITYDKPVIGITVGDVNGIGPEVIIKVLADPRIFNYIIPVVYGSTKVMAFYRKMLQVDDFNYSQVKNPGRYFPKKINVVNCWEQMVEINLGKLTPEAGKAAYNALEQATSDLKSNLIDALVTGPINKSNIQSDDFRFPGHTEYITEKFGAKDSLMMMVGENLKIGVVTGHIPLREVSTALSRELISRKIQIMHNCLRKDFAITKPRIAVLGLNPHAGDNGLLGDEDQNLILPVLEEMKNKGMLVFGPFPGDGFFGALHYRKFDGVMAMYHDQGLVPFKVIEFEKGVNFTAGLPIIRTSPDHGTAYDLAGKGEANESSMREAVMLARDIVKHRQYASPELAKA